MRYYLREKASREAGPFTWSELRMRLRSGAIADTALVRDEDSRTKRVRAARSTTPSFLPAAERSTTSSPEGPRSRWASSRRPAPSSWVSWR